MRADAKRNYDRILAVAGEVVAEEGAEASMRDVARRANVGLATLLRHFPTRDALFEALLQAGFEALAARAESVDPAQRPAEALQDWLREFVACAATYRGVVELMTAAIAEPGSALHASCTRMRAGGAALLAQAQAAGVASVDLDGTDLFALASAIAWLRSQSALASRADHLSELLMNVIITERRVQR